MVHVGTLRNVLEVVMEAGRFHGCLHTTSDDHYGQNPPVHREVAEELHPSYGHFLHSSSKPTVTPARVNATKQP